MKKVVVFLCALGLIAVPACRRKDSNCQSCHERTEKVHDCGKCRFFGQCLPGEERTEHHRYDDAEDVEMEK